MCGGGEPQRFHSPEKIYLRKNRWIKIDNEIKGKKIDPRKLVRKV